MRGGTGGGGIIEGTIGIGDGFEDSLRPCARINHSALGDFVYLNPSLLSVTRVRLGKVVCEREGKPHSRRATTRRRTSSVRVRDLGGNVDLLYMGLFICLLYS